MNKTKRTLIKSAAFAILFIIVVLILSKTNFNETIDKLMNYKNDNSETAIFNPNINVLPLIAYRFGIYFLFPLLISIFNFVKKEKRSFGLRLIENLESEFFGYSFLASIYYIFGLDVLFRSDIFGIQDSIVFLCSAIVTLVLDKTFLKQLHE